MKKLISAIILATSAYAPTDSEKYTPGSVAKIREKNLNRGEVNSYFPQRNKHYMFHLLTDTYSIIALLYLISTAHLFFEAKTTKEKLDWVLDRCFILMWEGFALIKLGLEAAE